MSEQYLPAAKRFKLLVRELADETLVYDEEAHRAHCLNRTAAAVWRRCDGRSAVPRIAERVSEDLSAAVPEDVVWLALGQLAEFDLLSPGKSLPAPHSAITRRKMLGRLGLAAAVSLPLITSIVSPTAAQAASGDCRETGCPDGENCVVVGETATCEPIA